MDGGEKLILCSGEREKKETSFKARPLYGAEQRQAYICSLCCFHASAPYGSGGGGLRRWRAKGRPSLLLACGRLPPALHAKRVRSQRIHPHPHWHWALQCSSAGILKFLSCMERPLDLGPLGENCYRFEAVNSTVNTNKHSSFVTHFLLGDNAVANAVAKKILLR